MRVAILSDIHGNSQALESVLEEIPIDIKEAWILGDFFGYYYDVKGVLRLLGNSGLKIKAIRGNHEIMLKESAESDAAKKNYIQKYGSSIEDALHNLDQSEFNYLVNLPDVLRINNEILLSHGSPWNFDEYIYPDAGEDLLSRFLDFSEKYFFVGHTHYPMAIDYKSKKILNPGSVGQQRNGVPGAHWALFDLDSGTFERKVSKYNVLPTIAESEKRDPNLKYLTDVLRRGM